MAQKTMTNISVYYMEGCLRWFIGAVLKTVGHREVARGFESHTFFQFLSSVKTKWRGVVLRTSKCMGCAHTIADGRCGHLPGFIGQAIWFNSRISQFSTFSCINEMWQKHRKVYFAFILRISMKCFSIISATIFCKLV